MVPSPQQLSQQSQASENISGHDRTRKIPLSFEFFPPKSEQGMEKLSQVKDRLIRFEPDYVSVTYGAGGSTRDNTKGLVKRFMAEGVATAPHLSFGGDEEQAVLALIDEYRSLGVNRIVALRGDLPSGLGPVRLVYANELVALIRQHFGDQFIIEVAAYPEIHPEADSYQTDIQYLKAKFDAGANAAITQYFFNPDAYDYFLQQCQAAGIDQAIVPGIMPITNYQRLARFSHSCGAEIPRWISKQLETYGDDAESIRQFGIEVVTRLCEKLLAMGAPGLHFYCMNQAQPCESICDNLGF